MLIKLVSSSGPSTLSFLFSFKTLIRVQHDGRGEFRLPVCWEVCREFGEWQLWKCHTVDPLGILKCILLLGFGVNLSMRPSTPVPCVSDSVARGYICALPCRDPFTYYLTKEKNIRRQPLPSPPRFPFLSSVDRTFRVVCEPRILHGWVKHSPKEEDCMDRTCRPRPRPLGPSFLGTLVF